jgi:hypothetical protein
MTSEDREDIKRLFGVFTEDLRSQIQQVAEGVAARNQAAERFYAEFDAFRAETGRNFADVGRQFAAVRGEAKAFREETVREFAAVRTEMAAGFATVRSEIAGSRTSTALPGRPRTRRRPN